jgi:GNAT superfamily N-acetyltransferase
MEGIASLPLLANIVWHTLAGPQSRFSEGTTTARRYARGFSPVIAFVEASAPDFPALEPYCDIGEHFYCGGWAGPVPPGWSLDADTFAHQMVWAGGMPVPDAGFAPVRLGPEHVTKMLELVASAPPGPFGRRTIELGECYGVFDGDRLVAMAGERMQAGTLREISGVCTHPDYQGQGHARRLVETLVRLQLARGQVPFLHVMHGNDGARRIYERAGFRLHQDLVVRVVTRTG